MYGRQLIPVMAEIPGRRANRSDGDIELVRGLRDGVPYVKEFRHVEHADAVAREAGLSAEDPLCPHDLHLDLLGA